MQNGLDSESSSEDENYRNCKSLLLSYSSRLF